MKNKFDLHENKHMDGAHFRMNDFTQRRVFAQRQLGKAHWQLEFISSRSTGLGVLGLPVTAIRAPKALISVSTNVIPRYPEIEKMNDSPYAWTGFCENVRNNNYKLACKLLY